MLPLRDLRGTGDWTPVAAAINALNSEVRQLQARLGLGPEKRAGDAPIGLHPFALYRLPIRLRASPDPTTDWRKFRVRAGRCFGVLVTGTGMDDVTNPDSEEYGAATDIEIPSGQAKHFFWVQYDAGANTAALHHGIDPSAGGWTDWDDEDHLPASSTHFLIGWVDTSTDAATKVAHVRQLIRADIFSGGGGGAISYRGEHSWATSYAIDDIVRISAGPDAGTYICVAAVTAPGGQPATSDDIWPYNGVKWHLLGRLSDQSHWQ